MRLDYRHELPDSSRAMSELERVVEASTLDPKMRELIKLRASPDRPVAARQWTRPDACAVRSAIIACRAMAMAASPAVGASIEAWIPP